MNKIIKRLLKNKSATELALDLNVSRNSINLWLNDKQKIPLKRCFDIDTFTNGQIKFWEVRPDIFQKHIALLKRYNLLTINLGGTNIVDTHTGE
jgi:DNA-binding transcriptional regulator YdaS (Cro superfamily)